MSKKDYIIYNTFSDVLKEDCLPLFNYGRNDYEDQLSMLSLFSGCGGMDIGFEGGFICNKRSVPANSQWIERELNDDWVLLKKPLQYHVSLGDVRDVIQNDFAHADGNGYIVLPPQVLHAGNYGVPETRERVIFIGIRRNTLNPTALHYLEQEIVPQETCTAFVA